MDEKAEFPSVSGDIARAVEMLDSAVASIAEYAGRPVPLGAGDAVAADGLALLSATGRLQAAVARLLGAAEAAGGTRRAGHRDLGDFAACKAGLTREQGRFYATLAHPVAGLGATAAAVDDGTLSAGKASRIMHWVTRTLPRRCRTAYPDPADFAAAAQDHLLTLALDPATTCRDIDILGGRLHAVLDPRAHEEDERRLHADRSASLAQSPEGGFAFAMHGDSASGDRWRAALEAFMPPPAAGDDRKHDQRMFDAALDMADFVLSHGNDLPQRGGAAPQVRVTVPLSTLRGVPGSPPATSDYGTVWPLSAVRALADDCRLRRIVTEPLTGRPLDVGREERLCPPHIRAAVLSRYSTCQWEHGCDRPAAWCEMDHVRAWWDGGSTALDNIQPLCRRHNVAKERLRAEAERAGRRRTPGAGTLPVPRRDGEPPPGPAPPRAA